MRHRLFLFVTNLIHRSMDIFRLLGAFGTESRPRYIEGGELCPTCLNIVWPPGYPVTVKHDCAYWYDPVKGKMIAKLLEPIPKGGAVMHIGGKINKDTTIHINGAPTSWERYDGKPVGDASLEMLTE